MDMDMRLRKATYHLWTFTISKVIAALGGSIYAFGISFYILTLTGSATSFAMNLICSILPRTLLAPVAGYIADTRSKKAIIIVAQAASVLAVGGLLTVVLTTEVSLIAIYITTCILSVTSLFAGVTFTSAIANLIDDARIQKAMSFNQASLSIAMIGGPALGGLLYGTVSLPIFLAIFMVTFAIATFLESTMNFKLFTKIKEKQENEVKETMMQSMKSGIAYLRQHRILTVLIWVALVVNFFFGAFQIGFSFVLIEKMKIEATHFGIVEAASAIGMLITSIYFGMRKELKYPLLVSKWGIVLMGVLMGFIAFPLFISLGYIGNVIFYFTVLFGFGILGILVNTPIGVLMQKRIDEEYRGRVFGIVETCAQALMPLAMIVFGFLYDIVPAEWILLSSSICLIISVLWLLRPSLLKQAHPELGEAKLSNEAAKPVTP